MKQLFILGEYVTVDKAIARGMPVFKGTRIAVSSLFDYLVASNLEEFLEEFSSVSRIQAEAVIE